MPFQIIRNDITEVTADAIVNTANPKPVIGGGTDSAIYKAAGEKELLAERAKIGNITPGEAFSTPAFNLKAKYIIHTVGPAWIDGNHKERETLHSCYANSLELAAKLSCESIAFPLIATGTYGFPKEEALDIALAEIGKFLLTNEMEIILVVFDKQAMKLSKKLIGEIEEYIDEHTYHYLHKKEYRSIGNRRRRLIEDEMPYAPQQITDDIVLTEMAAPLPKSERVSVLEGKSLDEILHGKEDSFQQRLFKLIDERGMTDVSVYKRANIDRKVFSKIRCNKNYKPQKRTAVAFAIALELNMEEMTDLLSRAELALSPGSKFDLIIAYFITNKNYNILEINTALFEYGQPLLGC